MRFMILVKATKDSEAGKMPSRQLLADMGKFNQELMAAGVMIDGGGLRPSSTGARVTFSGNDRTVSKGPFAQTNELVSGYWIWKLNSLDEAIAWVKRCPKPMIETSDIEIRQFYEMEDFANAT
jgi:PhnB protein